MSILQKIEEKYLLAPKILYFVLNMQYYTLHQFRPVLAMEKFSVGKSQYGKFSGIIMFITFFTNILIGFVSDRTRRPKGIMLFLTIITSVIFINLYIPSFMNMSIYNFWLMILLYLAFNNPKQPLLDKIMLDYLGKMSAGPKVYGKQRLWGTIAYGAATFISEWCLLQGAEPKKGGGFKYNFDNLIWYCLVTTVVSVLSIMFLITGGKTEEEPKPEFRENTENQQKNETSAEPAPQNASGTTHADRSVQNEYILLLKNKEFLFFIFIIFSNAITRSAMSLYLTSFHREVLKLKPYNMPDTWPSWITWLIGLINNKPISALTFFGIVFEILVMFISEPILNKLGFFWPLLLAQICSLVRFFAYYAISSDNPHAYGLSCIFEFIKGIYFGLAHISSVQIATRLAPPHLKATSQMIYQGTFNALGSLIGGYVFGKMFDSVLKNNKGSGEEDVFRQIFMINGLVSFVTILIYFYKYGIRDRVLFNREAEEAKLNAASIEATA